MKELIAFDFEVEWENEYSAISHASLRICVVRRLRSVHTMLQQHYSNLCLPTRRYFCCLQIVLTCILGGLH